MNANESLLRTRWEVKLAVSEAGATALVQDKTTGKVVAQTFGPRSLEIAHAISLLPDLIRANADRVGKWVEYFALKSTLWPDVDSLSARLTREIFQRLEEAGPNSLVLDREGLPMPTGKSEKP